jgi:hypothetical protein
MAYTLEQLKRMRINLGVPLVSLDEAVTKVYNFISKELREYPIYPSQKWGQKVVDSLRTELDRVVKFRDKITDYEREKFNQYYKENPKDVSLLVNRLLTEREVEARKILDDIEDDDGFEVMLRERLGPGYSKVYEMEAGFVIELFKQYKSGGAINAMLGHIKDSLDSKSY